MAIFLVSDYLYESVNVMGLQLPVIVYYMEKHPACPPALRLITLLGNLNQELKVLIRPFYIVDDFWAINSFGQQLK